MNLFALPAVALCLLTSCKNPVHPSGPAAPANSANASASLKTDTAPTELSTMLGYFRKNDSGRYVPRAEIDKRFIIKVFKDTSMGWDGISAIHPIDMTQNRYGAFFILQLNCSAGGQCEEFYLLGFNTGGHPVPPESIGGLMADADFLQTFDYRIAGDTTIVVNTKNYDGDETLKDSSVIRYPLVIQLDSLVAPRKRDSLIVPPPKKHENL